MTISRNHETCLNNKQVFKRNHVIRSQIFTDTINKIALSANDGNRIVQDDKTTTGHHGMQE